MSAKFLISAVKSDQYPDCVDEQGRYLPEVAFVGRSNVGKSSLINHLTQNKSLARVSSTPGKTQMINFFTFHSTLMLVDLPGYGFAKVAKEVKHQWGEMIQDYLQNRSQLKLILVLCDSRHPPSAEDLQFAEWATYFQKPYFVIFTKTDKLSKNELRAQKEKWRDLFPNAHGHLGYSIKDAKARAHLMKEIQSL